MGSNAGNGPLSRRLAAYGLTSLAVFSLLAALWAAFPGWRDFLSMEDGPIEGLTVALYLAGAIFSIGSMPRARRQGRGTAGHWLLAGLCLLAALDEASYGEGLFPGLPFPSVLGVKLDSIHDLLEVGQVAWGRMGAGRVFLVAAAALLSALLVRLHRPLGVWLGALLRDDGRWTLVAIAATLGLAAQAMDVFHLSVYLEETLELEASIAVVFAAIAGATGTHSPPDRAHEASGSARESPWSD